jgi:hypothetical protein
MPDSTTMTNCWISLVVDTLLNLCLTIRIYCIAISIPVENNFNEVHADVYNFHHLSAVVMQKIKNQLLYQVKFLIGSMTLHMTSA